MHVSRTAFLIGSLSVSALGQDLLTVTRLGEIAALDSTSGVMTQIAAGNPQQSGLARDGAGTLWTTAPLHGVCRLVRIDAGSGSMTPTATLPHFPHSLATANGHLLFAAAGSQLLKIDTVTGAMTTLGATGLADLGGIVTHQGVLYGWDRLLGLVSLDVATGLATDVNPAVGNTPLATYGIDWLAVRDDGVVVGGAGALRFTFDVTNGHAQFAGVLPTALTGAVAGVATSYGAGCNGGAGAVQLSVNGTLVSPSSLVSTSTGHGAGNQHPGVLVFGFSDTAHGGNALPFDLGPLLGTQGCALRTSIDATVLGLTNQGALQFTLTMPPGFAGLRFHLQHAVFEPVVGGMSWSQGVRVHLGR